MDIAVIGTALVALGSLIANIAQIINFRQHKLKLIAEAKKLDQESEKVDAETADIITRASGELVKHYRLDLDESRDQIVQLKAAFDELSCKVDALQRENEELREVKEDYDLLLKENEELWKGVIISLGQLGDNNIAPMWRPTSTILRKYSEYLPKGTRTKNTNKLI